jgi:hypothetical protein
LGETITTMGREAIDVKVDAAVGEESAEKAESAAAQRCPRRRHPQSRVRQRNRTRRKAA